MEEKKDQEVLSLFRLKATREILQYLDEHGGVRYRELEQLASTFTLTTRLRKLQGLGLVKHHFEKRGMRREWYTITEKGRKVLKVMRTLLELERVS